MNDLGEGIELAQWITLKRPPKVFSPNGEAEFCVLVELKTCVSLV